MDKLEILRSMYGNIRGRFFSKGLSDNKAPEEVMHDLSASILAPGPFYYFVFNPQLQESIYASEGIRQFFDIEPSEFRIATVFHNIHPDDRAHLMACEEAAIEFMWKNLPKAELRHYKICHCFRMQVKDGSYRMILHQGLTYSVDAEGLLEKSILIHSDISHITMEDNRLYSLIGLNGRPSYIGIDPYKRPMDARASTELFTPREKEILRLLSNGLSAKEIAATLFISYNTVRSHKQNMLQKAGVKNAPELLAQAIELKII